LLASLFRIAITFIFLGTCWSSLSFFWPVGSFIDLTQSLGRYFLFCHVLALLVLLFFRKRAKQVGVILFLWNVLLIGKYSFITYTWYYPQANPAVCTSGAGQNLKVLFANVNSRNKNYDLLKEQIKNFNPDYVAINELTPEWVAGLSLKERYPHVVEIPQLGNFGIALYSKYRLSSVEDGYGMDLTPSIKAIVLEGPHSGLQLVVAHSLPPLINSFTHNRILLRRIATEVRHADHPVVVAGDFNATIYSGLFRKLFWGGEMQHAGAGGEYFSTWDVGAVTRALMIDHILYKGCIQRKSYRRGEAFGSDHYPLLFEGRLLPAT
jgi:endonuclease/exonuclease/phosphatase (EEP) superfamily protein YafD